MCCPKNTLNGLPLGGNTEGGRLHRHIEKCNETQVINKVKSPYCCSPYKKTIQAEITSSEGNRIERNLLVMMFVDRVLILSSSQREFKLNLNLLGSRNTELARYQESNTLMSS